MHKIFSLLVLVFVVGCSSNPAPMGKPLPNFDYSALTPYTIQQGYVEVRNSYLQYERPTQADFVRSPDVTVQNYALQRFNRQKGMKRMVFDVQKLSLTKEIKDLKYFDSMFGDQKEIYKFNLFVAMIPINEQGQAGKPYTVTMDREMTLTPDHSIAAREFRQFEFLEKAMSDLDGAVTDIVAKMNY